MAEPEVWSEISHTLVTTVSGEIKKVSNINAIISSLDNILGTRKTERVMLPEFGSDLWTTLFQPMDLHTTSFLSNSLKESIEAWEDRVIVTSIDFKSDPDSGNLEIQMSFQVVGYPDIFTFTKVVSG